MGSANIARPKGWALTQEAAITQTPEVTGDRALLTAKPGRTGDSSVAGGDTTLSRTPARLPRALLRAAHPARHPGEPPLLSGRPDLVLPGSSPSACRRGQRRRRDRPPGGPQRSGPLRPPCPTFGAVDGGIGTLVISHPAAGSATNSSSRTGSGAERAPSILDNTGGGR